MLSGREKWLALAVGMLTLLALGYSGEPTASATSDKPNPAPGPLVPDTPGTTLSGAISSRTDDLLGVGDNVFSLTADTVWRFQNQPTTDVALFDVGDIVIVKAAKQGAIWVAVDVALIANLVSDAEIPASAGPPNTTFAGPLEAIGQNSLTVESTVVRFDDSTKWRFNGVVTKDMSLFDAGDQVLVTAQYAADQWTATEVYMLVNNVSDEPAGKPVPAAQVFTGQIQNLTAAALALNETTFTLTDQTQWVMTDGSDGKPALFAVGDTVQIIAAQDNGHWTALRVTMIQDVGPGTR